MCSTMRAVFCRLVHACLCLCLCLCCGFVSSVVVVAGDTTHDISVSSWPIHVRAANERLRGELKYAPPARLPPKPSFPPYTPPSPPPQHMKVADTDMSGLAVRVTKHQVEAHEAVETARRSEAKRRAVELGASFIGKNEKGDVLGFPCPHHMKHFRKRFGCELFDMSRKKHDEVDDDDSGVPKAPPPPPWAFFASECKVYLKMCVYDKNGHFVKRTACGDVYPLPCDGEHPVVAALEPAACPECDRLGKLASERAAASLFKPSSSPPLSSKLRR